MKKIRKLLCGRRRGSALILTLAILGLLLVMAMAFTYDAMTTAAAAGNHAKLTSARLMANSGIYRALGVITREMGAPNPKFMAPGRNFHASPSEGWVGRVYLPSVEPTPADRFSDTRIYAALGSKFNLGTGAIVYTSSSDTAKLHDDVAWIKIMSKKDTTTDGSATTTEDVITGRVAYVVVDCTGLLDPTVCVSESVAEGSETRTGASLDEINLASAINATLATSLQPTSNGGTMPATGWLAWQHIFRTSTQAPTYSSDVINYLFPYTVGDPEQFWTDFNDDNIASDTEVFDRLDITQIGPNGAGGQLDVTKLYKFFITGKPDALDADLDTDVVNMALWIRSFIPSLGLPTEGERKAAAWRTAAQLALNLVDWADEYNDDGGGEPYNPDVALINGSGVIEVFDAHSPGAIPKDGRTTVYGIERGGGLSELYVKVVGTANVNDLDVQVYFRTELINPFSKDGYDRELIIDYDVQAANDAGSTPWSGVQTFTHTTHDNSGEMDNSSAMSYWDSADVPDPNTIQFGGLLPTPGTTQWRVKTVKIISVQVKFKEPASGKWRLIRQYPVNPTGTNHPEFILWNNSTTGLFGSTAGITGTYEATVKAKDPMFADRDGADADFADFWDASAAHGTIMSVDGAAPAVDLSTIGNTSEPCYNSANYCDAKAPANDAATPFARVGEIGRVHSPHTINRSVRLWAKEVADETGHDGYLLDMFCARAGATPLPSVKGRINLNTASDKVATALFTGTGVPDILKAVGALLDANGADPASTKFPFVHRGDIYRLFRHSDMSQLEDFDFDDSVNPPGGVESWITRLIEFTGTRQNYFTIIATAQTLKDIGGIDLTASKPNCVKYDSTNNKFALIEAEQKFMAVVYRDAWTNRVQIIRVDPIEE